MDLLEHYNKRLKLARKLGWESFKEDGRFGIWGHYYIYYYGRIMILKDN